ncbi:MAG TPA: glycoside hydrolase family 127 protein [Verrucomicrobiae bacterium]|jgi:hypothetical protein
MRQIFFPHIAFCALVVFTLQAAGPARDYPVKPVPFTSVQIDDDFWAPRIETNRLVTIPFAFEQCEKSGRIDNFIRAAEVLRGENISNRKPPPYPFDDTDPYKVLEGASYALAVQPDPKMKSYLDDLIAKIAAAQEPDGYLYTARTINPEHPHPWSGDKRWIKDTDESHELYDAGHLFEAAVANYQATGERAMLNIAIKEANLLCATFGTNANQLNHIWPGHEIVEMGLPKLYRATGDERYLKLAKFFIDVRGPGGDDYHQSNIKPVDQREAEGHAVRAGYLYSGMADVAALTGDQDYIRAIDSIWEDVVGKKLYITGGIGALGAGEAFGPGYFLPNMSAYCETCAAVANAYWNQRLFLLHGNAKYVDVLERTLYNGILSGVSLDGKRFFYPNPLESNRQHARSPWFGVACCPGNITRFLPSVPGYLYAHEGTTLYVNLFAANKAEIKLDNGDVVKLTEETRYPWDGHVRITLHPDARSKFTVKVRVPGWARNQPVDTDLYKFIDQPERAVIFKVNGKAIPLKLDKGYASVAKMWKDGDTIELNLPMPIRRVQANDAVKADQGRVALQRGPIVYCLESPDNPGIDVRNLMLPENSSLTATFEPSLLNGVEELHGTAFQLSRDDQDQISETSHEIRAIPYFAWANRGCSEMMVWIPDTKKSARIKPHPTIASLSKATSSPGGKNLISLNDLAVPTSSSDSENTFFDWWPHKGENAWVEYTFSKKATVSTTSVYWFDDTGTGECRVPQSWRILYKNGDQWKPVEASGPFDVDRDKYNKVSFTPVVTTALRLEVQMRSKWSAGIQEWAVP